MNTNNYYRAVPFHRVTIDDSFWAPKLKVNRKVTIPKVYQMCKETGRIDAFKLEWKPGMLPIPHIYWDSDVAKWIEAVSYSLSSHPDADLEAQLDEVIAMIASAQQEDGYLNTYYTVVEPGNRWTNLRDNHELYCAGHMMEAAVAHYQATGKRSLLDVLCKYADYIDLTFGPKQGQKRGYCGHQEIELALIKLYRTTGVERYLQLSSFFIEERGQKPQYFDLEAAARKEAPGGYYHKTHEHSQSHSPVRDQDKVVGHAVRAMYMYSAMADLSTDMDDDSLYILCERFWNHLCTKNMYITGGIGSSAKNEGFVNDYELPNETAYCETCASVGLILWNHRMLHRKLDGKFADVMERALYNVVISGRSLDGKQFFYGNPLAAYKNLIPYWNEGNTDDYYQRSEWFKCSCCPTNIIRLLASLGEYAYAVREGELVVHLYMQGQADLELDGRMARISQRTKYPWDGEIKLRLELEEPTEFALKLRIPGWCKQFRLSVNGKEPDSTTAAVNGYVSLTQLWKTGDEVTLYLDMPVERVYAHPAVRHNIGHAALQRGPIVYCIEQADHKVPIRGMLLPVDSELKPYFVPDLLGGVVVLRGSGVAMEHWQAEEGGVLYSTQQHTYAACDLVAVPYYVWANREPGEMKVWIPEAT